MSGFDSNPSHVSYPSDDSPNLSDSGSSETPKNISNQNVPIEGTSSRSPPLRSLVRVIPEEVVKETTKRPSLRTDLKPVKLKKLEEKNLYFLNPLVPYRVPNKDERLDSYSKNTIALSVEAFRYASCFPVPLIIEQLCTHFDLSPSQLMPHV